MTLTQYFVAALWKVLRCLNLQGYCAFVRSACRCVFDLVTAFSDILLILLFQSMRASPKANWSMTLDVNLSSARATALILQYDLWPDGHIAWRFCKGETSACGRLHSYRELLTVGVGNPTRLNTPSSHISCLTWTAPLDSLPTLQILFRIALALLRHSLSPLKKWTRLKALWKILAMKLHQATS